MKYVLSLFALALATAFTPARADVVGVNGYEPVPFYNDGSADSIVSFDWDPSSNLYYQSVAPDYSFGGLYEVGGGKTSTIAPADENSFAGDSVVSIGNFIYYNDSSSSDNIYQYGPTNGTPTLALTSTAPNYLLAGYAGGLYISGGTFSSGNSLTYAGLNATTGQLNNAPAVFESDTYGSGPLAFDSAGNLYYVAGYNDASASIYKFTAAEVAAATAGGTPLSLAGHEWASYASLDPNALGGSSLLIDGNQVLLTLTDFSGSSELASFTVGSNGAEVGDGTTLVTATDRLGEVREENGAVYLADDSEIYQVTTPEPSTFALLGLGALLLILWKKAGLRRRPARLSLLAAALVLTSVSVWADPAGPYAPAPGQTPAPGGPVSDSIPADDPYILYGASSVVSITRGPEDIADPNSLPASYGTPANALGLPNATVADPSNVVSLGDGGSITLGFPQPIANNPGADFAVFENGFQESGQANSFYLELAFVAVSSDGIHFFTFPSVSLTQSTTQVGPFGTLDPTNIYNLAGNTIAGYGTPFDLSELAGVSPFLNINAVTEVRITDVVGDIDSPYASYDSEGNIINDPFPTDFPSGGFDLDAVVVIKNPSPAPEPAVVDLLLAGIVLAVTTGGFLRSAA